MPFQVSQNYRTGKIARTEVAYPALQPGGVIIRSLYSVVSPGTEGTKLKEARLSLIDKARARPDQVKQLMSVVRQQGVRAAYQKVLSRLDQLTPLGYSVSGEIVAVADDVEEFSVGDRVAAGGAGLANHADFNFVPRNLVVEIPQNVSAEHAALTTIGSIAMHAYRQSDLKLGETALVIGLGLVGQLLCQILVAAGGRVVGIDLDGERCKLAAGCGASLAEPPNGAAWRHALRTGADHVFIAAGSSDNTLLQLAAEHVRDRGRIVVIGKTRLDLDYNQFFKKEIDVRFSRSYGPGRFDPDYEVKGQDYPLAYVRWTERRNMAAFLTLIADGKLNLSPLLDAMRPFEQVVETYEALYQRQIEALGVVFSYVEMPALTTISTRLASPVRGQLRVGVIGAGNYASSMVLPELRKDPRVDLAHVVTNSGLSAASVAKRFEIPDHGTDVDALLSDQSIRAVIIATRHSSHAQLAAKALKAGKAVFVEKPLAISHAELDHVRHELKEDSRLMVGFNRRYSPSISRVSKLMNGLGPLQMMYRVQAGALPDDAWQNLPEEGGRFIGEAGHFFDVFRFLAQSPPVSVHAVRLQPHENMRNRGSDISATVLYRDGSVGTLVYSTIGSAMLPKEYLEVHGGGCSIVMANFEKLEFGRDSRKLVLEKGFSGKGQQQQLQTFLTALATGARMPVDFEELADVTGLTLDAFAAAKTFGELRRE